MIVEFHDLAKAELDHGRARYEAEREGLGEQFLDEMEKLIVDICERPGTFVRVEGTEVHRALGRRFPYQIVFLVFEDVVHIVCIAHQHQKPGYWKDRL